MGLRVSKFLSAPYLKYLICLFTVRRRLFGFQNANMLLRTMDKRAAIPILIRYGAKIGNGSDIETPLTFHNCSDYSNLAIGENCHVGKEVFFDLKDSIVIHDSVTISMRVAMITHIDVGKSPLRNHGYDNASAKIVFGNGSYVGANAVILKGVTIGECAVVGAGAVVTKDVPPYTVVAGNPAHVVKKIVL